MKLTTEAFYDIGALMQTSLGDAVKPIPMVSAAARAFFGWQLRLKVSPGMMSLADNFLQITAKTAGTCDACVDTVHWVCASKQCAAAALALLTRSGYTQPSLARR